MLPYRREREAEIAAAEGPIAALRNLPVALFFMTMGLWGTALAHQRARAALDLSAHAGQIAATLAGLCFLTVAGLYGVKLLRYPGAVAEEIRHPIKQSFFPAISINLLLLSQITFEFAPGPSRLAWITGAAAHLLLTLFIVSRWMRGRGDVLQLNPTWFVPTVGNVIVALAGIHHAPLELCWFFFSVGFVFWIVLGGMILSRLFFHPPLPEELSPTLFLLLAPPALIFLSYHALTSRVDVFARIVYHAGLFTLLLLLPQVRVLFGPRFLLSSWASSFPLAALTSATMIMYRAEGGPFLRWLSCALLLGLSLLVAWLLARTLRAALQSRRGGAP